MLMQIARSDDEKLQMVRLESDPWRANFRFPGISLAVFETMENSPPTGAETLHD